jgi:hypothetical protein
MCKLRSGSTYTHSGRLRTASDLAIAIARIGTKSWTFAANADYCFEPGHSLLHFIEAAILTDRPTVAFCSRDVAPYDLGLSLTVGVADDLNTDTFMGRVLEDTGTVFKATTASSDDTCDSKWLSLPLYGLPPSFLEDVVAGPSPGCSGRTLEQCLVTYSAASPLTACREKAMFSLTTVVAVLYADRFFHHLQRRRKQVHAVRAEI